MVFCCSPDNVRMNRRHLQVVDFLEINTVDCEDVYIAMSNECGYDFLLSRIDDFDDSYASSNSQQGILGRFIASPCTDTKFFVDLFVSLPCHQDKPTLSSTYVDRISIPSVL